MVKLLLIFLTLNIDLQTYELRKYILRQNMKYNNDFF